MEKIIILGSSGAGKSTFARKLSPMLQIKVFHLDRFFWGHNWKRKTRHDRMEWLEKLIFGEKQWIIEGNYFASLEPAFKEADTIIFLDIAPLVCLWRIVRRHHGYRIYPRRDIPEGSTDKLTLSLMIQVLTFPFNDRKRIEQVPLNYHPKYIIRIRSLKEVKSFLSQEVHIRYAQSIPPSQPVLK